MSPEQCDACCEFPVPQSAVDNPVTSSLLLEVVNDQLSQPNESVRRCDLLMTREFALRGTELFTSAGVHSSSLSSAVRVRGRSRQSAVLPSNTANRRPVRAPVIGLVGFNSPTGLGYASLDFARELGISRWLAVEHPGHESLTLPDLPCRVDQVAQPQIGFLEDWLNGLDWLLFIETPIFEELPRMAADHGFRVACSPNHEWFCPITSDWLSFVDLLLCPVRSTVRLVEDWSGRFGCGWRTAVFPWPIAAERFPFVERTACRTFLFINGQGGAQAAYEDGTHTLYHRKGLELVTSAARLVPHISVLLTTQAPLPPELPENIELLPDVTDNTQLYANGDVCLQPSHWEGTGLPLLECQAAGMPLLTTDAAPMNEFQAFRHVPVTDYETVRLNGHRFFPSACMKPETLAGILQDLHGQDIREASRSARAFIETEHSWERARQIILEELTVDVIH